MHSGALNDLVPNLMGDPKICPKVLPSVGWPCSLREEKPTQMSESQEAGSTRSCKRGTRIQWGKIISLANGAENWMDIHMKKNEVGPLLHTIYENYLQVDHRLKRKG